MAEDLSVMITGVGAPGIKGIVHDLKNNYDKRKIKLNGADIDEENVGKYLVESFYKVPNPSEKDFVDKMLEICKDGKIDIILPQITKELEILAENREKFEKVGTKIAVSSPESVRIANNKYLITKVAYEIGVGAPEFSFVKSMDELEKALDDLGYPEKPVVVKPPISTGTRGLRIVDEKRDRFDLWANEKPTGIYTTKEELKNVFKEKFPELLITEYLPGNEYTVDVLADEGKSLVVIPRKRLLIKDGITFEGITEKHEKIIEYSKLLAEKLKLNYACGFQFKLDENDEPKILECNPRVQGTMVMAALAGANITYSALKLLLGEKVPEFNIKWGTKFVRYWGGFSVNKNEILERI